MYGAIIGDIVGSRYEFNNIKTKDFPFITDKCEFTDDTIMTVAVARALLRARAEERPLKPLLVEEMQSLGRKYPHPRGGYGGRFSDWLRAENPRPYNSFGNGSAMRVSPCGLLAVTLEEATSLARASAEVTHNHPEGIKGAEATAAAIFLARMGRSKEAIRGHINDHYYPLSQTLDEIRAVYRYNETCQDTVPQAIVAFLESHGYEDAIRNAISLGGDSDTLAAIAGSIAWSFYRFSDHTGGTSADKRGGVHWPVWCENIVRDYGIDAMLPADFVETVEELDVARMHRFGTYDRSGFCSGIIIE